jgi:hypothetical protein
MVNHNKAVHISVSDKCHHHAMLENCFISNLLITRQPFYYASAFLRGARFGFVAVAAAVAAFLVEAARFSLVLILVLLRLTPKEPIVRLPFLVFLSPLPMSFYRIMRQV